MNLRPATLDELQQLVRDAVRSRGRIDDVDLSAFKDVLAYHPEDMTVSVQAGLAFLDLQTHLGKSGQWLPLDPEFPANPTIRELLSENLSGPRRYGHGTVRDYLIGIKVLLANGSVIKAGGNVVKNVAGYDLCKLFVGARGSLGIILEATFKVLPRPQKSLVLRRDFSSVHEAFETIRRIQDSPVCPVVLDVWRGVNSAVVQLVIVFEGSDEEVDWQNGAINACGLVAGGDLDYGQEFWKRNPREKIRKISASPSALADKLEGLASVPFVCRAGNGVAWHTGEQAPVATDIPQALSNRIKSAYDPVGIFPDLPS